MSKLRKLAIALGLMLTLAAPVAFAQGPLHKRVIYTINADHSLRMGDYILPPGRYELFQINLNNPNLFALYEEDLTREPIALIQTVRVDFAASGYPEKTKIYLDIDEEMRGRNLPVMRGWTIPGMDGWEIISVVQKRKGALARYNSAGKTMKGQAALARRN